MRVLESEGTMFFKTIVHGAARSCGWNVSGACHNGNQRELWLMIEKNQEAG